MIIVPILSGSVVIESRAPVPSPAAGTPLSPPELDRDVISALDREFESGKYGYVDGVLILHRGQPVFERAYVHDYRRIYGRGAGSAASRPDAPSASAGPPPSAGPYYRGGDLHALQSITKSITGVVIAIAAAQHEFPALETPVMQFFDEEQVQHLDARKRRMTIRHLLTMTSGLEWNEEVAYRDPRNTTSQMNASADWAKFAIDRPMADEPGVRFSYNSGATMLLSHVFKAAVGSDIQDYARRRLFEPLGIQRYHWARSPSGLTDTKGGLYMRPADLARIGQLLLQGGVWNGTRLLDAAAIGELMRPAVLQARSGSGVTAQYGYQWWVYPPLSGKGALTWAALGFGGQRLLIAPEYDLVVVVMSWSVRDAAVPPIRELVVRLTRGLEPRAVI